MNLRVFKASAAGAVLLFLAAAGCTDTTVQPKSTISEGTAFGSASAYTQLIAKVYAGLALTGAQGPAGNPDIGFFDEGFSSYLRNYWEMQELPTDEAVIAWGDVGLPVMNTSQWDAGNGFIMSMYYRIFYEVALANDFLRLTEDAQIARQGGVSAAMHDTIQTYRAEARYLRALAYYHAIDFFGDVPLVTSITSALPTQSKRADVYAFAVNELQAIQSALPKAGNPNAYGRATDQAANMLLAELYLNAGVYTGAANWSGAMAAAQAVINSGVYQLEPNYRLNFMADNDKSRETIFVITSDGVHTQSYGATTFIEHASCGGSMVPGNYGLDGCWYGLRLKPQADSLFNATADHPAGDVRNNFVYTNGQTLAVGTISNFNDGYAFPKFTNIKSTGGPGSNLSFADTDFPVWRLAEAYLIYAEACLQSGGGACATTALNYINQLRSRAYGNLGTTDSTGYITAAQLTLPFLLAERGRELMWEAHRRTDLIRYGLFTTGTYLWAWKGGAAAGDSVSSDLNLYPFPTNELTANPNLKQNPGY